MKKALIAMSGGVDSSVAAKLTKDNGFECIGCTMKLYNSDYSSAKNKTCCSLEDTEDARSVAYKLGMPYYVFNFTGDFYDKVIKKFIASYEKGVTPNPCIDCNRYMKFEKLYERAKLMGCEYVVTGHYAIIEHKDGKYLLKKAVDSTKDQSYVLYSMTQEQLKHTLFPLGKLNKNETREIARTSGFWNSEKPDSQDICFVPDGDYVKFIEENSECKIEKGSFVDKQGNSLGEHKGIVHYTIGQHKKLGLSFGKPMYVLNLNTADNTVVLGDEKDLYSSVLYADDFNWISGVAPTEPIHCKAKIRYRQSEESATVTVCEDSRVKVEFDFPQRAITKGQAVVLYDGDIVLGGGVII
ncbi:MAG: tRNA 2-thiouridine(34) synthase MnmA [Clostridiales bacterium]|nr:tRNA 2-thiouridine(34) synthase MnmA [Clostridiales bacterium]